MAGLTDITLLLAATEGASGEEESGGNFLVTPELGLMIWTLIAFGITLWVLNKYAYPRIQEALDKRRRAIEESIQAAERTRKEADELLTEYRARLAEAREQADDIVVRARRAADKLEEESKSEAKATREQLMEQTRREIEAETRRSLDRIRKEVATLTVVATEKVTRKSLDEDDQKRLIDEALGEVDFSVFAGEGQRRGGGEAGNGDNGGSKELGGV